MLNFLGDNLRQSGHADGESKTLPRLLFSPAAASYDTLNPSFCKAISAGAGVTIL